MNNLKDVHRTGLPIVPAPDQDLHNSLERFDSFALYILFAPFVTEERALTSPDRGGTNPRT